MNIRKTLLLGFLLVGVTPAVILAALGFARASRALQHEIEQGLVAQAQAVSGDVNRLLYERAQNAATWSRLEVMQDLQVGDVDKRLSDFLQRLQRGYGGLYCRLMASDAQGRVLAASDPAWVGRAATAPAPADVQRDVLLGEQRIGLRWRAGEAPELELQVPLASAFGHGVLGRLHLVVDGTQLQALLDRAAAGRRQLGVWAADVL